MWQPAYRFLSGQTMTEYRISNIEYPISNVEYWVLDILDSMVVFLHRLGDFPSQQEQQRR